MADKKIAEVAWTPTGRQLVIRLSLRDMSHSEKVQILDSLLEDMGLKEKLWDNHAAMDAFNDVYLNKENRA